MTTFVVNRNLWSEIRKSVKDARRSIVAVAYFGTHAATSLEWKRGDVLVVDMSVTACRQGVTNPNDVQQVMAKGVKVFSRQLLHAKIVIADEVLIASSANISSNSQYILDEAGIRTTDAKSVASAKRYVLSLCSEPVSHDYVSRCIGEYRTPTFKAAKPLPRSASKRSRRDYKLWYLGDFPAVELGDEDQASMNTALEKSATKRKLKNADLPWLSYRKMPPLWNRIHIGEYVICCTLEGRSRTVYTAARIVDKTRYLSVTSGRWEPVLVLEERANNNDWMSHAHFRTLVAPIVPRLNKTYPRVGPIADNASADAILKFWTPKGRITRAARK